MRIDSDRRSKQERQHAMSINKTFEEQKGNKGGCVYRVTSAGPYTRICNCVTAESGWPTIHPIHILWQ